MCKHVAAVLYGVGARLDEKPELLFTLRGVRHEELISASVEEAVGSAVRNGRGRRLADSDLSEVFGVELDASNEAMGPGISRKPDVAGKPRKPQTRNIPDTTTDIDHKDANQFPAVVTGKQVKALRNRLGLSGKDFALLLGVSSGAVSSWEKKGGELSLHDRTRKALAKAWAKAERQKINGGSH
jgi:uncharacterized Zn finger protein